VVVTRDVMAFSRSKHTFKNRCSLMKSLRGESTLWADVVTILLRFRNQKSPQNNVGVFILCLCWSRVCFAVVSGAYSICAAQVALRPVVSRNDWAGALLIYL